MPFNNGNHILLHTDYKLTYQEKFHTVYLPIFCFPCKILLCLMKISYLHFLPLKFFLKAATPLNVI